VVAPSCCPLRLGLRMQQTVGTVQQLIRCGKSTEKFMWN
jgi:hypothetical protein